MKLTAMIKIAPDSSVKLLLYGSVAYITQIGQNNAFITYLILANILGGLTCIFSCSAWLSQRICCRRDRRKYWMEPLQYAKRFCCDTIPPPGRNATAEIEPQEEFPLMERQQLNDVPRSRPLAITYSPRPVIQD